MPASKEVGDLEEAAAALMDFAGMEKEELKHPTSLLDVLIMATDLRRLDRELVAWRGADFRVHRMLAVDSQILNTFRARASATSSSSQQLSEVLKFTYVEGSGVDLLVEFVPMQELIQLVDGAMHFPLPAPAMPMWWRVGFSGLHLPGCSCVAEQGVDQVAGCSTSRT